MVFFEFEIVDGSNQVEAQSKAFAAIAIAFTQDAKDLQFPNDILNQNTFFRNCTIISLLFLERGNIASIRVEGLTSQRTIYMVRKRVGEAYRPRDAFWSFVHAPENADLLHLSEGNK